MKGTPSRTKSKGKASMSVNELLRRTIASRWVTLVKGICIGGWKRPSRRLNSSFLS